ncbi:MAG: saccharopine dehydrogenase family protein [Chloroflexota bacterium]
MAGRIVVFGATGYTGRLVSEALVARGQKPTLAGRDAGRLRSLAGELGGLETAVADVARPETVAALVERGDVLASTVGPFARWGGPALDAAIGAGAHYIDSTGEPSFIRRVFEREGPRAEQAGCGLLTAMGYDWVPGNLAGALALRDAGDAAAAVRIGYFFRGRAGSDSASGGTKASAMGVFLDPQYRWHDGRIVDERSSHRVHSFELGGRSRPAVASGSSEAFALPRFHPGLREVDVYVGWFGGATKAMAFASRGTSALLRIPGARSAAHAAVNRFVKGSTGGPSPEQREGRGSEIVAEALDASGRVLATVRVEGVNGYTFTGAMIAWAAEQAAAGGLQGTGALGPVDGFGLDALEQGAAEAGIRRVD